MTLCCKLAKTFWGPSARKCWRLLIASQRETNTEVTHQPATKAKVTDQPETNPRVNVEVTDHPETNPGVNTEVTNQAETNVDVTDQSDMFTSYSDSESLPAKLNSVKGAMDFVDDSKGVICFLFHNQATPCILTQQNTGMKSKWILYSRLRENYFF